MTPVGCNAVWRAWSPVPPGIRVYPGVRNIIIQNRAGLIVFAAGVPLYTSVLKSQAAGRVFFRAAHP
tara:strand:- start:91 stop:291 length:201 start_codon:yes stop_codon:yes gene_type:complete